MSEPPYGEIERLAELFDRRLVSRSFIDKDDLRQELFLIYVNCNRNYTPERGEFIRYYSISARNRMFTYMVHHNRPGPGNLPQNVACKSKENIEDYLPIQCLTQIEQEILSDYLDGYTCGEIEDRHRVSKDAVKNRLKEIVLKIQEANEKNQDFSL